LVIGQELLTLEVVALHAWRGIDVIIQASMLCEMSSNSEAAMMAMD
jgi:hypothetical protein